ncbi:MAG: hypothetical protein HOV96_40895 [Nonomuraea sp.]|nr:hypothetical protein [Nonomuraea sp.]NUP61330.1 hypothetical protein [Nonomuraea sp.]NUP83904.1 hypothetical protein [Nonomuraea sp.]NUS02292.1 hypothetical protein [Nonomuraea sp.]
MTALMTMPLDGGGQVTVEIAEDEAGPRRVSRPGEVVVTATKTLEKALEPIRAAAAAALASMRSIGPDEVELEFGVKLNAETGAVIAKAAAETHMVVRLTWRSPERGHR